MTDTKTDQYVFDDNISRDERFERYQRVFFDEPMEILCRAGRRQDEDFKSMLRTLLNDDWMRPLRFERDYESLREARFDFVYDRKTGLVFRGLAAQHSCTMSILYRLHTGQVKNTEHPDINEFVEARHAGTLYLEQGMGAYVSSIDSMRKRKRLRCSERFEESMTPKELECFEGFEILRP